MFEHVDLGVCPGRLWEGDPDRLVLVCPGAEPISVTTYYWPLSVLRARGFSAVEYVDVVDRSVDPEGWVRERAEAAIAYAGPPTLLLAKSLGTFAAGLAAERSLPAVWLTPLLHLEWCVAALRLRTAPALLVGGTEDEAWNGDVARELGEVLELEGAGHSLGTGDPWQTLDYLKRVCDAVAAFA